MEKSELQNRMINVKAGAISVIANGDYDEAHGQGCIQITFSDNAVLHATYWRLIKDGKAILSSFDHKQQYGLPAPIDAIKELQNELKSSSLSQMYIEKETGDLWLVFAAGEKLQIFNVTGYEIWSIQFPNGTSEYSNHLD